MTGEQARTSGSGGPDRPRDVLCFGTDWYSPSKVSIRQIVEELHERGGRVLWINPIPIRFPNTRQKDFWNKVQTKARTHARFLSRKGPDLYVYSPLYLPYFKGPGFFVNRVAVSLQVLLVRLLLGFRRPLVTGSTFTAWFGLPAVRGLPFVFHFADKISSFREVSDQPERRRVLEEMERDIVRAATLATCSSRAIRDHVSGLADGAGTEVMYLPHAVKGSAFFDGSGRPLTTAIPRDMADLPRPVAGYFGSLTATNDQDTFLHAACALPQWSFVFIGRVSGDYSRLEARANVHFLGAREHEVIPAYASAFDVCFMGWRAHEWIQNCFPLKTLEYLAAGKPVVCAGHIEELTERFPELVVTTGSAEEFTRALQAAVRDDSAPAREARQAAVRNETWQRRVDDILSALRRRGARYDV